MHLAVVARWLPKYGNSTAEYEDAFSPGFFEGQASRFHAAVADGATETSFAGEWAQELADGFTRRRFDIARLGQTLPRIQRRWRSRITAEPLPWYAEEKLLMGAYSSLVGLNIYDSHLSESRLWHAVAIGDSCIFHLRAGRLLNSFPLSHANDFTNRPRLLSSMPASIEELNGDVQSVGGSWEAGDTFLLATDAIAQWYLRAHEQSSRKARSLVQATSSQSQFQSWMERLRARREIRNDDVTVLSIRVDDPA